MPDRQLVSGALSPKMRSSKPGLRPRRLADFTGQNKLKENLSIAIEAARKRGEAMDHVLLYGPPGLGKTTLACHHRRGTAVPFTTTSGPVLQKKLDLTGILSNIRARQVFFIDEIHRLMPDVEEMLYSALEDFRVDILVGWGPGARTHSLPMPKFTAIGATTRQGLVSAPLRGPLRPGAAPRIRTTWTNCDHRGPLGAPARTWRSTTAPPRNWRAAAGARRASPTACCAACATTRRCAPTAASRSRWRRPRSTCSTWTATASTRSTRRSC
jgi:SpoVK/Ycf46/Vps4 family AAA+-type ATPase